MAEIPQTPEDQKLVRFHVDGTNYETHLTHKFRERRPWRPEDRTMVTTLIPGLIMEVLVTPGQTIERGQGVVVLEAMKMCNEVQTQWAGTVKRIAVEVGETIPKGTVLVELE